MSVTKDASGRRSIAVEVEVPGTPEEVWQAIATGPGVSSWFVPMEGEEREGGTITMHFGPGMDSVAKVTAWDPPRRFAAESDGLGPDAPPMATEWQVEARSGGTCVVRVVHSLFAETDDWDNQLTGMEEGWPTFFRILRLYLTEFRGMPSRTFQLMGMGSDLSKVWERAQASLGLGDLAVGQAWKTPAGAPAVAGRVVDIGGGDHPSELLKLEEPAPGALAVTACAMGGQAFVTMGFYLYGDSAPAAASGEPQWQAWMQEQFPMPGN